MRRISRESLLEAVILSKVAIPLYSRPRRWDRGIAPRLGYRLGGDGGTGLASTGVRGLDAALGRARLSSHQLT